MELQAKGVKCYYLVYKWEYEGKKGSHAIVMFEKDNKWFIVDNEESFPRQVKLKPTTLEMIKEFCPEAYELQSDVTIP